MTSNLILSGKRSIESAQRLSEVVIANEVIANDAHVVLRGVETTRALQVTVADVCETTNTDFAFLREGESLKNYKLIVFDMDSTLINVECIDEVAAWTSKAAEVAAITYQSMQDPSINFESSLRARTAALAGVPVQALRQIYEERIALSPGVLPLISAARNNHLKIGLISGGFTFFAELLQQQLSLDFAFANELEISNQQLTGRVTGPVIDGQAKATLLRSELQRLAIDRSEAIVVGDGSNDIPMMNEVEFSVAYRAKPLVRRAATHRIDYGAMDVILHWLPA